jgi:dienelactone hydrolase
LPPSPAQAHGWAIRGNDKDETVADAARDAFARAAAWFKKTL